MGSKTRPISMLLADVPNARSDSKTHRPLGMRANSRGNSPPNSLADMRAAMKAKKNETITQEEVKEQKALGTKLENFALEFDNAVRDRSRDKSPVAPRKDRFANLVAVKKQPKNKIKVPIEKTK